MSKPNCAMLVIPPLGLSHYTNAPASVYTHTCHLYFCVSLHLLWTLSVCLFLFIHPTKNRDWNKGGGWGVEKATWLIYLSSLCMCYLSHKLPFIAFDIHKSKDRRKEINMTQAGLNPGQPNNRQIKRNFFPLLFGL